MRTVARPWRACRGVNVGASSPRSCTGIIQCNTLASKLALLENVVALWYLSRIGNIIRISIAFAITSTIALAALLKETDTGRAVWKTIESLVG